MLPSSFPYLYRLLNDAAEPLHHYLRKLVQLSLHTVSTRNVVTGVAQKPTCEIPFCVWIVHMPSESCQNHEHQLVQIDHDIRLAYTEFISSGRVILGQIIFQFLSLNVSFFDSLNTAQVDRGDA